MTAKKLTWNCFLGFHLAWEESHDLVPTYHGWFHSRWMQGVLYHWWRYHFEKLWPSHVAKAVAALLVFPVVTQKLNSKAVVVKFMTSALFLVRYAVPAEVSITKGPRKYGQGSPAEVWGRPVGKPWSWGRLAHQNVSCFVGWANSWLLWKLSRMHVYLFVCLFVGCFTYDPAGSIFRNPFWWGVSRYYVSAKSDKTTSCLAQNVSVWTIAFGSATWWSSRLPGKT